MKTKQYRTKLTILFSFSKPPNDDTQEVSEGRSSPSVPKDVDAIKDSNSTDSSIADQQNATTTAMNCEDEPSSSSNSTTAKSLSSEKTLVQTLLNQRFVKTTKAHAEKITMAIAYLIAVACLAYSFVENIGFRHFMNVVVPNYQVPSRKVFSDNRIPKLKQATKAYITEEMKNIEFFGITTDGWTSSNSHKFIAVTVSFINENWQLVCRTLACRDLNISNTGENIKCLIESILGEFKVEKRNVTAAVSDRGANCVLAVQLSGFEHVPCFAHAINTKMEEMLAMNFIAPVLSKIKGIYATLSRSKNAKNFFGSCQKSLNLSCKQMPSSCPTRWWSETGQFKFVIDNEMALYKFITTYPDMDQTCLLSQDDISRIKAILLVMEPMEKYVTTLGSETVATASIVVPLIRKLDSVFNKFKFHDPIACFEMKKFFKSVPKFLEKLYIEEKSLMELATYLDPRFKDGRRMDLEVILRREINELKANQSEKNCNDIVKKVSKRKSALEELFDAEDEAIVVEVATHELNLYYSQLKIPITDDPLLWWKNRSNVFPYLSRLAKKYLCVPATSVLSERVFSRGGKVVTKETSRITDQHAEELIFLHMNKEIVPKNV